MSTVHKSDVIASLTSANPASTPVDGDKSGGVVLFAEVQYTLKGTEAATNIIELFDLPAGATVIPQLSNLVCPNPGTALVLSVGGGATNNKYAHTITASAGGVFPFHTGATNIPTGITAPARVSARERVYARITTATTLNAGVKLNFTIAYRIRG
jgi:hypothetical protein